VQLVAMAAAFWVGLLWGRVGSGPWVLALVAVLALGASRRSRAASLAAASCAFLLGGLLVPSSTEATVEPGLARVVIDTSRTTCGESGCWSEGRLVRCEAIDSDTCPSMLGERVGLVSNEEPPLWATVGAVVRMAPRPGFHNPSPHPGWAHPAPSITANASRPGVPLGVRRSSWLGRAITQARVAARAALDRSLSAPHAGIARALLLGDGGAVDRELDAAIRQAGVSHVLAVSGMHVTVLAGALVALARRLWLWSPGALYLPASRVASALGVALSPLVACLCGSAPSAFRAAWTSALMFMVQALGRRPCPLRVSALAVAGYGAIDPRAARHPGFVLSVLATVALLTAAGEAEGLLAAARESFRAWLSTSPFLLWAFGSTSIVALAANVLLLPLGGALIPIACAHLFAALLGLEPLTRWLFETASGAFVGASRLCAALDPGLALPPLTCLQGAALSVLALSWLVPASWRARAWVAVVCGLAACGSELWLRHDVGRAELRVTFLDVGQGDAALIEVGSGERLLIDGGGEVGGGPDPGAAAIVPLLRALRIDRLDAVVLSHPHPDHYGGLFAVLDAVKVSELWDTGQARAESEGGQASRLLALAERHGTRVLGPGQLCGTRHLGSLVLEVLAPCPGFDESWGPNDNSFVIKARHGATSFLFTGDIEHEAEAALLSRGIDVRADVLKVPHHGSRSSSTEAFVRAVHPTWAVVSAGRGNRFGHPHAEVEARLRSLVRNVLRTDLSGGITMTSDGTRISSPADPSRTP
jgi:competence protein ComEC